jgi:outer membrane protein TolC
VKSRIAYCVTVGLMVPCLAAGQSTAASSKDRLSLEAALRLALENNRALQSARLETEKADDELAVARTHRLPSFETSVTSSYLLTPVSFSFPRGSFGDFAGIGPVPATDTMITTPRRPSIFVSSQLTQPISQLFQIGLTIRGAAKARDIDRESVRDDYTDLLARTLKTLPMVSKVERIGLLEERVHLEYSQERLAA